MINLLPDSDRKNNNKEYRLRRLIIVEVTILMLIISMIALMLPTFAISWYKKRGADVLSESSKIKNGVSSDAISNRSKYIRQLTVLMKQENYRVPTDFIELIIKNKTSENSLHEIKYAYDPNAGMTVNLKGVAKTRKSLQEFTDALKREREISSVDVPVSVFAKDINIEFAFTITSATSTVVQQ
jgi:hypothetical protein